MLYDTDREDLKVKVYSGLYVNEAGDIDDDNNDNAEELVSITNMFMYWKFALKIQVVLS